MRKICFALAMTLTSVPMLSKVTLPSVYTDNMVLQQQSTLRIHGKAAPGSQVELQTSWSRMAQLVEADAMGCWYMEVGTPKAGGPHTLTFSDGEELTLHNVMVGEVWLGSGQSNMEMPVAGWGKVLNYEEEIRNANYPNIRLFQVKRQTDVQERDRFSLLYDMGGWQECSPQTVPQFSALCYFYALRLWEELKVPVGVIDDNWGGTPCEAWVSADALGAVTGFEEQVDRMRGLSFNRQAIQEDTDARTAAWKQATEGGDKGSTGITPWQDAKLDDSHWSTMELPAQWEKAGLPGLDGVVWFRRTIEVPAAWEGKQLTLSLGPVDDYDVTYWNGTLVGATGGYDAPRTYTIDASLVKAGKVTIAVRVKDDGNEGGIWGKPEQMALIQGDQRIGLAGTWHYAVGFDLRQTGARPLATNSAHHPTVLFNAMIHPLVDFPVRGILWYQGCTNVGRDEQHEVLFQTLIHDWRKQWCNPDMPFYFVQLANYLEPSDLQPESPWAFLRESQAKALCLPHTGMVCNIDLGDAKDIHPKTKREVGRRMAAIALHHTYGQKKTPWTAPVYKSYTVGEDGKVTITFDRPEGCEPLVEEDNLPGFIIASADRRWHVAKARTEGDKVVVWADDVPRPVAVRYGWADNPTCTLRTASGLHVAPFRTDSWPRR